MALANEIPTLSERVAALNAQLGRMPTEALVRHVLGNQLLGRVALVSSFGAESVVLLHLIARAAPDTPVLFIDTGKLFAETLAYQQALAERLALRDLRVLRPDAEALRRSDPDGALHLRDADACCALRKVEPLERGLRGFDAWITGRKRFQTAPRSRIQTFECDGDRIKFNPLCAWTREDLERYMVAHDLPRHPLSGRGYLSIGCAPCTAPVAPGEDARAGRWRTLAKTECGIHGLPNARGQASVPLGPARPDSPDPSGAGDNARNLAPTDEAGG